MTTGRRGARVATAVVLTLVTGCGVPATDGPQPLPADVAELAPSEVADSTEVTAQTRVTDLAWVKGQRLRVAPRQVEAVDARTQASAALAALIAGPSGAELARGLSTEVPPDLVAVVTVNGSEAVVDLQGPGDRVGAGNPRLASAQLALAVLLVPGVRSVRFTVDGRPVDVPRGDGKVRPGAVTLADYAGLLGPARRR